MLANTTIEGIKKRGRSTPLEAVTESFKEEAGLKFDLEG